jgi:hypothetical protein
MTCSHCRYYRYLAYRIPPCTRLKYSPIAPDSAPGKGGLRCRRVSPRLQTRSRCQRALASPRAPWHRARHPSGEGSGVFTCPTAPNPPPVMEGSGVTTYPVTPTPPPDRGEGSGVFTCPTAPNPPPGMEGSGVTTYPVTPTPPPDRRGLRSHHVSHGSRPVPYVGRL